MTTIEEKVIDKFTSLDNVSGKTGAAVLVAEIENILAQNPCLNERYKNILASYQKECGLDNPEDIQRIKKIRRYLPKNKCDWR